jgi:hypothetical protein
MRSLSAVGCLLAIIASLAAGKATAQFDQGLSDQDLIDPWLHARLVVLSLTPLLETQTADDQRERLEMALSKLADQLSQLQTELEKVAIRIVTVPEFAYDAAHKSSELSTQVLDIEKSFDGLLEKLQVRERPDVRAMQGFIDSLGKTLHNGDRFERDVVRAIASGSRNEMQALAGRWWRVGESVEGVKLAVESLRSRPAAAPDSERRN